MFPGEIGGAGGLGLGGTAEGGAGGIANISPGALTVSDLFGGQPLIAPGAINIETGDQIGLQNFLDLVQQVKEVQTSLSGIPGLIGEEFQSYINAQPDTTPPPQDAFFQSIIDELFPEGFSLESLEGLIPEQKPSTAQTALSTLVNQGAPELKLPEILDYTDYLRQPLMEDLVKALGTANPFDTRRDTILAGPQAALAKAAEAARSQLQHIGGLEGRGIGHPAFRQSLIDLESEIARAGLDIESQFGLEAARSDETLRRDRLGDISKELTGEFGRTQQQLLTQNIFQEQATDRYLDLIDRLNKTIMQEQGMVDTGLNLGLGGLGQGVDIGGGSSLINSLLGIGGQAGAAGSSNNALIGAILSSYLQKQG